MFSIRSLWGSHSHDPETIEQTDPEFVLETEANHEQITAALSAGSLEPWRTDARGRTWLRATSSSRSTIRGIH